MLLTSYLYLFLLFWIPYKLNHYGISTIDYCNKYISQHNEHHDFPRVPGWRLPQVKAIAPEFYDNLPSYNSWVYVLFKYVTDPHIGPFNRVRRSKGSNKKE